MKNKMKSILSFFLVGRNENESENEKKQCYIHDGF